MTAVVLMRLRLVLADPARRRLLIGTALALLAFEIVGYLVLSWQRQIPLGRDALSYLAAARAIAAGQDPYGADFAALLPDAPQIPSPYLYPPPLALALLPLAQLPLALALTLWIAIVCGSHVALIWLLARMSAWRVALAAVLFWLPAWESIFNGQVNALVACGLSASLLALGARRERAAGAWLALGALLKITPGVGLAVLVLRGHWRAGAAAVGIALAAVLVSLPWVAPRLWLAGGGAALQTPRANEWYTSLGAAVGVLPGPWGVYGPLLLATVLIGVTLLRSRAVPLDMALAAAIIVPLLVARTAWLHHAVIALPALAILWRAGGRARALAAGAWLTIGLVGLFTTPLALAACWAACLWPRLLGAHTKV